MIIEILLIVIFLGLVLFVIDTSKMSGLIQLGIAGLIVFPLVLVLEKKRENIGKQVDTPAEQADATQQPTLGTPPVETQSAPPAEAAPQVEQVQQPPVQ